MTQLLKEENLASGQQRRKVIRLAPFYKDCKWGTRQAFQVINYLALIKNKREIRQDMMIVSLRIVSQTTKSDVQVFLNRHLSLAMHVYGYSFFVKITYLISVWGYKTHSVSLALIIKIKTNLYL